MSKNKPCKLFGIYNEYKTVDKCPVKFKKIALFGLNFVLYKQTIKNNNVFIKTTDNKLRKLRSGEKISGLKIDFKGLNNTLIIDESTVFYDSEINIHSMDSTVEMGKNCSFANFTLDAMSYRFNAVFRNKVTCNGLTVTMWSDDSTLDVGEGCMFSYGINITMGDGHIIRDLKTNQIINKKGSLKIGDYTWIGKNATILGKDSVIGPNNIIGANSVVTKSFEKSHVAIAGNPAKIIKENVAWETQASYRTEQ